MQFILFIYFILITKPHLPLESPPPALFSGMIVDCQSLNKSTISNCFSVASCLEPLWKGKVRIEEF